MSTTNLVEAFEAFLADAEIRCLETARRIRATPELMGKCLGRPATLDDLTIDTARAFVAWRSQRAGWYATRETVGSLLRVWRWLAREGVVANEAPERRDLLPDWTLSESGRVTCKRLPDMPPIIPSEATASEWIDRLLGRTG